MHEHGHRPASGDGMHEHDHRLDCGIAEQRSISDICRVQDYIATLIVAGINVPVAVQDAVGRLVERHAST